MTGRNDSCPCGSGLKYKKCCLLKNTGDTLHFQWRRFRQATDGLANKIIQHWIQKYSVEDYKNELADGWDEFCLFQERQAIPSSNDMPALFMPWFLYTRPTLVDELAPAELYLNDKQKSEDALALSHIQNALKCHFSFYEVMQVEKDHALRLRDILLDQEFLVLEKSGTHDISVGTILFSALTHESHGPFLHANWGIQIPPNFLATLIDFRNLLDEFRNKSRKQHRKLTAKDLFQFEELIFAEFWLIHQGIFNPQMPRLTNTDGHELEDHTLLWTLDDPLKVFHALAPLCWHSTPDELLEDALFGDNKELIEVDFPWLRTGDDPESATVLGKICIQNKNLWITVNSRERAKKIKTLVNKMCTSARKKLTAFVSDREGLMKDFLTFIRPDQELETSPEELKKLQKEYLSNHWEKWKSMSIPALKGLTPIEASKSKVGQEMLRGLLNEFLINDSMSPIDQSEYIHKLRKELLKD